RGAPRWAVYILGVFLRVKWEVGGFWDFWGMRGARRVSASADSDAQARRICEANSRLASRMPKA
ncbi:MAG: hypothetical protein II180_08610, partial [Proteobacteria bacterium]|nr:hypothetical protein [Pseudomonadota bacterium]